MLVPAGNQHGILIQDLDAQRILIVQIHRSNHVLGPVGPQVSAGHARDLREVIAKHTLWPGFFQGNFFVGLQKFNAAIRAAGPVEVVVDQCHGTDYGFPKQVLSTF